MGRALIRQNVELLHQAVELLRGLDDELYASSPGPGSPSSRVGSHLRHCLDYYLCFLRGLEGARIDYDRRERRAALETNRDAALKLLERIIGRLQAIPEESLERRIEVRVDAAPGEAAHASWSRSSVSRELRFLTSHTTHHFALIALALKGQGVDPGSEFGVAPSTLSYWKEQGLSPASLSQRVPSGAGR